MHHGCGSHDQGVFPLDPAAQQAQLWGDTPALCFEGRWLSHAELDARASALAHWLHDSGVRHGDRVCLLALNHPAHFELIYAAPKLGFLHAPLNYRLAAPELRALMRDIEPALLIYDEAHEALASQLDAPRRLRLDRLPDLSTLPPLPRLAPPLPDDIWMLLTTGGTTGVGKCAALSYRQMLGNMRVTSELWSLGPQDTVVMGTPAFHAGVNVLSLPLLASGGRVVLMPRFEVDEYLDLLAAHRATRQFMVPTMYRMLIESPRFATTDFSIADWAICGGAPCPPEIWLAMRARGIRFRQGFGMTEAGVNCFGISDAEAAAHPDAVGHIGPGLSAIIRRADGSPCEAGEVGELTLSGERLCSGYWRRDAQWRETFRDGWLWTGDLAERDADGLYYLRGRRKEMYLSGGENVYPVEIETQLWSLHDVADAVVIGVPDDTWGEVGLAVIALRAGCVLDVDQLRERLRRHLAGYKLPRHFWVMDELPKTGAGKIARAQLKARWLAGEASLALTS